MGKMANSMSGTFEWVDTPRTQLGDSFTEWNNIYAILFSLGLIAPPEVITLSSGVLTAGDSGLVQIETEDDLTTDILDKLDLSSIGDGRSVFLAVATPGRSITVKHLSAGITNDGEINLLGLADFVLTAQDDYLLLQRRGSKLYQIRFLGLAQTLGLSQDLDMGGFAAYGGRNLTLEVATGTRTIGVSDRGKLLWNSVSCVYTMPMSQPVSGPQWQVGDAIDFRQEAASCSFVLAGGGTPRSVLNHDRGLGIGSRMQVELVKIVGGFVWNLVGMTQAAGGGGSFIERTVAQVASTSTIVTDAASTSWKNALRLTHTPANNEKWLYLAHGGFKSSGNQALSSAKCRFIRSAAGVEFGSGRYSSETEAPLIMLGASYGASPGSQDIDLDIQSGSTSYSATMVAPRIFGIKLETDEYLALTAGSASNIPNTGVYTDLVTITQTFPADDYYVFAWGQFDSANQTGYTVSVDVDGSLKHERVVSRHSGLAGYFGVMVPITLTAASHTIKLKAKSNGSWLSTGLQMGVAILRKGRFEEVTSDNSGTTDTTTSTTYADKSTLSKAMLSGWDYLIVADADLKLSDESSSMGAKGQLTRNGSRLGQEHRSNPRDPDTWVPVSFGCFEYITKVLATDAFAVQYCTHNAAQTASVKEGSLALFALKRT